MNASMTWQKKSPDGKEYKHLLKFFKSRPKMLVNCGIYREDNDGIYYFFNDGEKIVEKYLSYIELDGRPIRKTLTELATGGNS